MNLGIPIIMIAVFILLVLLYRFLTYTRHGPIHYKSGLVLKMLKDYKGTDVLEVRRQFKKLSDRTDYATKLPVASVRDSTIPCADRQIPVRLYQDKDADIDTPIICFIHGGGWCIGDLDSHDQQCRRMAIETGYTVISIDYQLSPEVKFPVALHEVTEVIEYLIKHPEYLNRKMTEVIIMGDSAGGNLSITSALLLIDKGYRESIRCIVPIYPVIDCQGDKRGSYQEYDQGLILTKHLMELFSANYIPDHHDLRDPLLSPIYSNKLSDLPPCFVLTAGFDPLRDEGEAFALRLKELGNIVKLKRYENSLHSFFGQAEFGPKGLEAVKDISQFIQDN